MTCLRTDTLSEMSGVVFLLFAFGFSSLMAVKEASSDGLMGRALVERLRKKDEGQQAAYVLQKNF